MKLTDTVQGVLSNLAAASKDRWTSRNFAGTWSGVRQFWSNEWNSVSHRRLFVASAAAAVVFFGASYTAIGHIKDTQSWEQVFSNGTYVGMVPNTEEVVGAMKRVAFGYHVDVRFVPEQTHVSESYDWRTIASLPTPAAAIMLNGQPLVYTTSASDAQSVLTTIKTALAPKNLHGNATVQFVGNVNVTPDVVNVADILSPEAAIRYLLQAGSGRIAGRGESFASISFQTAIMQTTVRTDTTAPIEVAASQTVTQDVSIPYTTKYVMDGNMGVGAVSVLTHGKTGRAQEQVEQTFVNGKLVSSKVLSKQVLKQPSEEIAKRGSNPGVAVGGWAWPAGSHTITSGYGWRNLGGRGDFHPGIDIGCPIGTPVYASNNGTVEEACWNSGGYGNWVKISNGGGIESVFGHLSRSVVQAGQMVSKGQLIGYSGSTGESTGPHLHYEIRRNGVHINPSPYM